jgi:hypothetical protein
MSTARRYKTKYLAKTFFICFAISVCLVLSAKLLLAQTPEESTRTIIVSPPTVSDNVDPGDKKEGVMKLTNTSPTDTLTFKAVVKDFIVEDTIGTPLVNVDISDKEKYAASSWVGVYPSTFTIAPGKSQEITYYVQVPEDARPGGRYAAVVYEPQERIDIEGTGTGVETHIGTLFIFRVNGDIVENATVKSFAAEKKFYEYGPATILTQIGNLSDSHIRPQGTIAVKNLIGQTIETVNLMEHNIFPEAARDYTNTVGKKYMFGMYTAELRATYGTNNNLTLFAEATFFVLPWKIVLIVTLIIVAVILLVIFLRRRKRSGGTHHQAAPQTHTPEPTHQAQSQAPQQTQ